MDSHDSGYCPSSTSSTSSTDSISFTPPRGPISAFDYRPANKRAIFFEERQNVLVEHNVESLDDALMVVPAEYAFSTHFWARIYYVNNNTILALLKEHLQKEFILVSFRLKRKDHTIVKLDEKRTEISTEGYQISSQRGRTDGEFCFGLCSRATHLGHRRKHSERANFALQLSELREQEEKRSGIQLTPGQAKRSASSDVHPHADANSSAPVTIKKHESVMLTVKCAADSGAIAMNILLVGRKTLGIKRTTFGPLWDFFRFKYTARLNLDEAENFVEPIRTDKNALFVNGIHPNTAILVPMQDIPAASAPLAAIEQLQRITGLSTLLGEEKAENVQQVEIVGQPPSSMERALWSNLEVVGKVAFLVIQEENLVSSLWRLHIEREDGSALRWEQVSKTLPLPADDYKAERFSVRVHDNKLCLRGCGSRKESPDEMNQFCEAFDLVNIAAS